MPYIKHKKPDIKIGDLVTLTEEKGSVSGHFEAGSVVKIIDVDENRGYTFADVSGNKVTEAGWTGFTIN